MYGIGVGGPCLLGKTGQVSHQGQYKSHGFKKDTCNQNELFMSSKKGLSKEIYICFSLNCSRSMVSTNLDPKYLLPVEDGTKSAAVTFIHNRDM